MTRLRRAARGDVRIHVEEFAASGPACLLVGGAGAISAFWPDACCRELASSGYRTIRFDHRDAGNSSFVDRSKNPYGLMDLVDDVMAILDACGETGAHMVGHSMGGFIVQLAAIHHPDRVLSLTSISSHTASPALPPPSEETWQVMLANQPTGDLEWDLPGYMTVWRFLNGDAPFDDEMAARYTRELYARNPATLPATNHVAIQAEMADRGPALRGVDLPALVIHGDRDPLVPFEGGQQTAGALGGSRLVRLPRAGHMFFSPVIWGEIVRELVDHLRTADLLAGRPAARPMHPDSPAGDDGDDERGVR